MAVATRAAANPDDFVVALDGAAACTKSVAGAKAANLSRASEAGLPVLPGFVLTTHPQGMRHADLALSPGLHAAWRRVSEDGSRSLAVRSSSVGEDIEASSMAGMFTSVLDVRGWDAFLEAVATVFASADSAPFGGSVMPMAVLVQRYIEAPLGGILFGLDPVSGRRDRIVVVAAEGAPEKLVSGKESGTRYLLTRRGRTVEVEGTGTRLTGRQRRALVGLARRSEAVFEGPQDIEWAVDSSGALWLLQSRPVTAAAPASEDLGPLLGPGPIAETFPDPLATLEQELWIEPLRQGMVNALDVVGTIPGRRLRASEVVSVIGGRAAVDLDLLGTAPGSNRVWRKLDPRPSVRRLRASWRVGRLRALLPLLAADMCAQIDAELDEVPSLIELPDDRLLPLMARSKEMLTCLHGQEILAGILMTAADRAPTAAAQGLAALVQARQEGLPEDGIPAAFPEVLALYPPRIGRRPVLPEGVLPSGSSDGATPLAMARERLRIMQRLVQELSSRTAAEVGRRGASRGLIDRADAVRWLTLEELETLLVDSLVADYSDRESAPVTPPLPAAFRVSVDGTIVEPELGRRGDGIGAGGGRGVGRVVKDPAAAGAGDILVVGNLDPRLAPVLPHIEGLVAETGSVLSHLAILAREFHVPTVVGVAGALNRFPDGATVVVDGSLGEAAIIREGPES